MIRIIKTVFKFQANFLLSFARSIDSIKSLHNEYKFWSSYEEKLFRSVQKRKKKSYLGGDVVGWVDSFSCRKLNQAST